MKIRFIGATKTVTGSMHLITTNNLKILLDCGLYQGKRLDYYAVNSYFNYFNPEEIDYLILSHSHIDHIGNIPNLVKKGFRGKIISTPPTKDLSQLMLLDSGHIQEKEIEFVNKKRIRKGELPMPPLYTQEDAKNSLEFFTDLTLHEEYNLNENVSLKFFNAGHILGSAIIQLKIKENGKIKTLVFTGDLGRPNLPIIKDPEPVETPDILISEGTYGGRVHQNFKGTKTTLTDVLLDTLKTKGKVIIPAFSESRTQQLILLFHEIYDEYNFQIPIFIDSPLATAITKVYSKHLEEYDEETFKYILRGKDPFNFKTVRFTESVEESKSLNELKEPAVIISASGMCETGRILHHLANNIENPKNTILIVGFNAPNTLGRRIADGEKRVKIFGDEYSVKAKVVVLDSLSAHADQLEFLNYYRNFDKKKLKKIFLVHGDEDELQVFQSVLKKNEFSNIFIPNKGDIFEN